MKSSTLPHAACAVLIGLASSVHAEIQSVTHTTDLPDAQLSSTFQPGSFGFEEVSVPITGLPQFDPALGTLTDVIVDFQWDFFIDYFIEAQGIFDGGIPHEAFAQISEAGVGINFERTDGGSGGSMFFFSGAGIGCFGEPGEGDGCSEAEFTEESAFSNGFSIFGFTTVIGTGSLDIFSVDIFYFEPFFQLDNVGTAFFDISTQVYDGSVSITYVYDDGISEPDSDGDGISDANDSCTLVPNPDQIDSDGDGYGNACDNDINNDCTVNITDLGLLRAGFFGSDPVLDFNNDGVVNVVDLGLMRTQFFGQPGPSGLTDVCLP
ncbi:MAG: hypothetical protein AB8G17_18915 [Gammaproteobacteria bacterium]